MILMYPADFSLLITGGSFEINRNGIGGVDLSGALYLPEQYNTSPLVFSHLRRLSHEVDGITKGFIIEEFDGELPEFHLDSFTYKPEKAHLIIYGNELYLQPVNNVHAVLRVPENDRDLSSMVEAVKGSFNGKIGLRLEGGSMEFPWESTRSCQTVSGQTLSGVEGGMVAYICKKEDGAFILDSSGITGVWALIRDANTRDIRGFKGKIDGFYMNFRESALIQSKIKGRLIIPYPVDLEIGFHGTLTSEAEIVVPEDGLELPSQEEGWTLSYWRMTIFPNNPPLFDDGRIVINRAYMRLDVDERYGGQ